MLMRNGNMSKDMVTLFGYGSCDRKWKRHKEFISLCQGLIRPFGALTRFGGDKYQMYEGFGLRKLPDGEMV